MSLTTDSRTLPLFYREVRTLNSVRDQNLCLMPPADYEFAAATNAIPLVAEEFFTAQAHYPIVFAGSENPLPVAIVGLRDNENLFVDADGNLARRQLSAARCTSASLYIHKRRRRQVAPRH